MTASLGVALGALAFTIASFWWMNIRRGRLKVPPPHAYALGVSSALFLLRLPLAIYNSGARAIIVRELRCWFDEEQTTQVLPLPWRTIRKTLRPEPDDVIDFASPFVVHGREAIAIMIEFGCPLPGFTIGAGTYPVRIEALDDKSAKWFDVLKFDLHVNQEDVSKLSQYLAYRNTPPDPDEVARGTRMLSRQIERMSSDLSPGNDDDAAT
jgi:hypothetical protein